MAFVAPFQFRNCGTESTWFLSGLIYENDFLDLPLYP